MSEEMSRRRFVGVAAAGTLALGAGLVGCSNNSSAATESTDEAASESTDSAATETAEGTAAATTAAAKPAILVTSFGTSFADSRHITIGAIESDIREAFPEYDVRRAFTAQIIIDHIEEDTKRHIDNFEEAMDKLVADGVTEVVVQPTHLTAGAEYSDIQTSLDSYKDKFEKCALGEPLLTSDADFKAVSDAVTAAMAEYEAADTAIILVGHGNEAQPTDAYDKFQETLNAAGKTSYFMCTVEQTPGFAEAVKFVQDGGYTKAVLRPFMVVAGDHANNDMAGAEDDPESLAKMLEAANIQVTNVIEGLGQLVDIDEIYVEHTQAAIDSL